MAEVPVFGDTTWLQKANHPRCRECGTSTSKAVPCFYCGDMTCPKCTRNEQYGKKPVTVCKSCHRAGKELDAEIKHEEQVYKAIKRGK